VFAAASNATAIDGLVADLERELSKLPSGGVAAGPLDDGVTGEIEHRARTFGQPTAFNSLVAKIPAWTHADAPALLLAGSICGRGVRNEVARKGTAYGAACDSYTEPGTFAAWSIRDPNVARTYAAFEDAIRKLREEPITDNDLALGRLEASVMFDLPAPPAERARRDYIRGRSGFGGAERARFLDAAQNLTAEDVMRAANEHLAGPFVRASLTSVEMAEKAEAEGYPFDVIREV
jgi:Zn-dependent M16 (insulinase) family peptidase